ncbi:hypothetical protein BDR03DRAFT_1014073 [Suillus americanus]|nr:hypothetical protein BDR03DRAFT_1014073 [Suillus americanus]
MVHHLARQGAVALMAVAGPLRTVEDDPGSPAPGQAAPAIASPSLDGRNIMDFDPGDQGVPSPVWPIMSYLSLCLLNNLMNSKPNFTLTVVVEHYQCFEEFGVTPEKQTLPAEEELWHPFQSRGDFEFSEIALNKNQVDQLLSLMARISQGQAQIMLKNEADLRKALDNAAAKLTLFSKHEVKVPYKKEEQVYEVHACPLWDWALDLLDNPLLAPHFVWDAQHVYKHDGYPVVVRCANLPVEIRNSEGISGGQVVRWLPIVPKDMSEKGKLGCTTLKCVAWHKSFVKLLVNLDQYSKTGYSYLCYDNILHWLFPIILILSGDYEEQLYVEYATTTSSIEDIKTDWNFPKTYLWKHVQWDIELKGVALNFSTCPNEKLHGPLKSAYLSQLNGKDVAEPILRINHHKCAALLLRGRVDTLDEQHHLQALGDAGLDDEDHDHINYNGHFKLSSPQSCDPIQDIENRLIDEMDHIWLISRYITQIHEYRYLKLNYESTVNWKQSTDHLQSNPSFHGSPCFDCALIQLTAARTVFIKIILMFKCEVTDVGTFQLALVQPYTAGIPGGSCRIDRDLRLTRVKAVPRRDLIFVPLKSFIQGAFLARDPEHQDKFVVVKHIDGSQASLARGSSSDTVQDSSHRSLEGSIRSILHDPKTPGTGQNVCFFSRDAYKFISPDASASSSEPSPISL